jgi:hypothetical protein
MKNFCAPMFVLSTILAHGQNDSVRRFRSLEDCFRVATVANFNVS